MARIFIAIPLTEEVTKQVLKVREVNEHIPKVVWMKTHNLHLTVYFIGDAPKKKTGIILERIKPIMQKHTSFSLEFDKICFAPSEKPRMIWALFHRSRVFTSLATKIHSEIKELVPQHSFFYADPIPHITLARFNSTFKTETISLPLIGLDKLEIKNCELWESVPSPQGVRYECTEKFIFNSDPP